MTSALMPIMSACFIVQHPLGKLLAETHRVVGTLPCNPVLRWDDRVSLCNDCAAATLEQLTQEETP